MKDWLKRHKIRPVTLMNAGIAILALLAFCAGFYGATCVLGIAIILVSVFNLASEGPWL